MVYLKLVPARDASPLSQYVNVVLKRGSTGTAVKACRRPSASSPSTARYGPATESRVKEYQKAKGLTVTGVVDRKVWNALMGAVTAPAPAPAPTAPAPHRPPPHRPRPPARSRSTRRLTLKLWSKGEAVKALQKAIGKLTVDGSYGRLTEARVKEYQKSKGLTVTGVTDAKVWKALMASTTPGPAPRRPRRTTTSLATEFTAVQGDDAQGRLDRRRPSRCSSAALGGMVVDGSFGSTTVDRGQGVPDRAQALGHRGGRGEDVGGARAQGAPAAAVLGHRAQARLDGHPRRGAAEGAADHGRRLASGP